MRLKVLLPTIVAASFLAGPALAQDLTGPLKTV